MPRVSGVSANSTLWFSRRRPRPVTVAAWVLLKPIVLRNNVTFSRLPAVFVDVFAICLPLPGRNPVALGAEQLRLVLAAHARDERRISQIHQSREGGPHHVV